MHFPIKIPTLGISFALVAGYAQPLLAAPPADWSAIAPHSMTLFYPGQSSFQWLRKPKHEKASKAAQQGDSCVSCHEGEEADLGAKTASGERLEPTPIKGKKGSIPLQVQVAYDQENVYFRLQWPTAGSAAGTSHVQLKFDGNAWNRFGGGTLDRSVSKGEQPALAEDRLSMMIDNGKVPMFATQGCWLTCHDGMPHMEGEATEEQVKADPLLGGKYKEDEVEKYLPQSRADAWATWSKPRGEADHKKLWELERFVDFMQWRAHRTGSVGMADDGFIMETQRLDEGQATFSENLDPATGKPRFMFDSAKAGSRTSPAGYPALVEGVNAVPFDAAGWKAGDLLPAYVVSKAASGSAADNQQVTSSWEGGKWTLVWTRKLDTGHADDKKLAVGSTFSIGFAVHDNGADGRAHYTGFPVTIGLGAKGDIDAVKLP